MKDTMLLGIADTYQTPLYIFDEQVLHDRVAFLHSCLPPHVGLCYAIKANPFILPELHRRIERFEVCSPGELRICKALGLDPEKLVVSGVHKDEQMIRELVEKRVNIGHYTVESLSQFNLLLHSAEEQGVQLPLLLRLTSGNQFGLDESTIKELLRQYRTNPHVDIRGIQFFSGTQKTSLKRLKREVDYLDAFLQELKQECGFVAAELEYGPGLPVEYFESEKSSDEAAYLKEFAALLSSLDFSGALTLELGRSLVATCGTYLTKVVDLKENDARSYAIVDGGMHHLVYYGQSMAMKQPLCRLIPERTSGSERAWNICGSLCTANDILAKQISFQNLGLGDVIAFQRTGAYCMTEGMSLFLSRDLPSIVVCDSQGQTRLVREALSVDPLNTPRVVPA